MLVPDPPRRNCRVVLLLCDIVLTDGVMLECAMLDDITKASETECSVLVCRCVHSQMVHAVHNDLL